ncbi:hypothetical protein IKG41_03385 [Candidatus Saccharibacteria bacterium]|nr:hypothetical protein [Candidatus Saccharibacteria bacterium]
MEYYSVKLPKILYLSLLVLQYTKLNGYTNTNDMAKMANSIAKGLVRTRKDKQDYKFLEDTNYGGLRGNFSTQMTLRGMIKRGSRYTAYYGIGANDRLLNAVVKGQIILDDPTSLVAHTNDRTLKRILEHESKLLTLRETQAHIKQFLGKNPGLPFERDSLNFPKIAVVRSKFRNSYFMRVLFNRFTDSSNSIIEYNLLNYWQGSSIRKHNMHILFVVPKMSDSDDKDDYWHKIKAIRFEDIIERKPLFIYYDTNLDQCFDSNHNKLDSFELDYAMENFSLDNANIGQRLSYDWEETRSQFNSQENTVVGEVKPTEFFVFLENFLKFSFQFNIDGKTVASLVESASGGPDVILTFTGGTKQPLELEHEWSHYVQHGHQNNKAFQGAWIYANEDWNFDRIKSIFYPEYLKGKIVPEVFLFTDNGVKAARRVDWSVKEPYAEQIDISELSDN